MTTIPSAEEIAKRILTQLGFAQEPSMDPGIDRRRDWIADLIIERDTARDAAIRAEAAAEEREAIIARRRGNKRPIRAPALPVEARGDEEGASRCTARKWGKQCALAPDHDGLHGTGSLAWGAHS